MQIHDNDIIAAIATPAGEGAISVIRVSGARSMDLGDRIFVGSHRLSESAGYKVHHGVIVDSGGVLVDEVLVSVFREPHSYTGEDSLEISCHGGVFVTNKVLDVTIGAGARRADPGEFTKRAFLNGKMDLSRAEAIADIISARSQKAHASSLRQLEGRLAGKVKSLKDDMVNMCSLLELELDFSEEGIPLVSTEDLEKRINNVDRQLLNMISSYETGRLYRDGVSVILVGKPNAGKSSLFNSLLKEDRAIVTEVPGTTRDFLEENITISGILFRLIDTAGLRKPGDIVEKEGVTRAEEMVSRVDVAMLVIDASAPADPEFEKKLEGQNPGQKILKVFNKMDLLDDRQREHVTFSGVGRNGSRVLVSTKTGEGIDRLRETLAGLISGDSSFAEGHVQVTNRRHVEALSRASASLAIARGSLESGATNEFVAFDIRQAIEALSEITGEITSEDILNNIFSEFCIGK